MSLTLQTAMTDLVAQTIVLQNGVIAQLTRTAYITPYENEINYQQFVPIVYFNIIDQSVLIGATSAVAFTPNDIFSATDWQVLNQVPA